MLFQKKAIDERTRSNTRYAAAIWLGTTQILLAGVVFYRLYVLGQPDEQIRDFQAVLGISIFGYLALQLFVGGVMPTPTWTGTWLPALLGPALFIGAYALTARLGQWRIERQIERLGE